MKILIMLDGLIISLFLIVFIMNISSLARDLMYHLHEIYHTIPYFEALRRAELCNMTFKPSKTVIAPRSSIIFGWRLDDGKWSPTKHVVSSLSRAERPNTCKQMRSFLGALSS